MVRASPTARACSDVSSTASIVSLTTVVGARMGRTPLRKHACDTISAAFDDDSPHCACLQARLGSKHVSTSRLEARAHRLS
eukprot:6213574-Pleurochrysis_carterae.AAC.6